MSAALRLSHFEVKDDKHDHSAIWRTEPDFVRSGGGGGEDAGQLLISLGVDGSYNIVDTNLMQTGTLTALNEAILTLERLRGAIAELPVEPGRCIKYGDEGYRCLARHGEPCEFPPGNGGQR